MNFSTVKAKYLTKSPSQTKKLGKNLARSVLKIKNKKTAVFLGLEGNLGGGKTTFVQGFAGGLGIKEKTTSPTFVILRKYKIPGAGRGLRNFYHIDCYRIQKPKEILTLGFKRIISDPQNIVVVEWAEKIKKIAPDNAIWLKFNFISGKEREIGIKNFRI